jgi:DNA-directed RNA polymerase subunit M/transcription elongation factor TFIIS
VATFYNPLLKINDLQDLYPSSCGSRAKGDISDETAGLELVTVASYSSNIDAEADRLALESMGLKSWIFNKHNRGTSSVQLQVIQEDWRAAAQILDPGLSEGIVPSSDLPDDIAEPPCPKCGSRNVKEEAEITEFEGNQLEREQIWFYRCASCGHKW